MGYKGKSTVASSGVYHNPQPSTKRGQRRHEDRDEEHKKRASNAWGRVGGVAFKKQVTSGQNDSGPMPRSLS